MSHRGGGATRCSRRRPMRGTPRAMRGSTATAADILVYATQCRHVCGHACRHVHGRVRAQMQRRMPCYIPQRQSTAGYVALRDRRPTLGSEPSNSLLRAIHCGPYTVGHTLWAIHRGPYTGGPYTVAAMQCGLYSVGYTL